ncbi:MerR family transcriptional regulator [Nocardia nova]|uniref:chaperone modulator CbpM n=1 Tax=Nocardia nova TaxID=37330 RepID=UPI000CE9E03D|nr:chaperone modulator CbpM [Nocardia nova]PPJ02113.1 MerR family transcriptional regulator [Nocardia nova]
MSTPTPVTRYVLVCRPGLSPEAFAERTGLHPDLARRLVALGLLDAHRDAAGEMSFEPSEVANAARIQRLRTGLGLNYSAIGLVLDLLDRIEKLEAASRARRTPHAHRQPD